MSEVEYVTYQQVDRAARRIENQNFSKYQRSLSASGIARFANPFIVEIRPGKDDEHGIIVMKKGWREAMKKGSEEWHAAHEVQP